MKKSIKILVAAALVSSPLFADCVMANEGGVFRLVDFSEGWIFSKAKLSADGANIESVDYPLDWTATQVEPFKGSLYKVNFALDKWSDDSSRLTFHSGDCHYTLLRDGVIIDSRNNKVGHLSDWSRSGLELVYHYDEAAYKGSIELISGNDRVGLLNYSGANTLGQIAGIDVAMRTIGDLPQKNMFRGRAAVVPEPSAFAFIAGVLALAGAFALRRRIGRGS